MKKYLPIYLLILLGVLARLLPHAPNFAPIAAIALFGGLYLPRKMFFLPLAAMFLSDIIIGFYSWPIMATVYGCFIVSFLVGQLIKKQKNVRNIFSGTIFNSLLFFVATNLAVWAFGTMYPLNIAGLAESYVAAIPFFRNTLLGDMFYVTVLVGGYEAVKYWQTKRTTQEILA
ncbi:MAG TPA: DUF6580 family putative transport protein [Patescibacteria group bacterium]|nr:DUF6580 family putative transport protein [Patescibacteria group bacterium]